MKKDKKIIYFLLPVIILVWAFVFYQLYNYFFKEPQYFITESAPKLSYETFTEEPSTIVANYRDPFLGNRVSISSPNINQANNTKPKTKNSSVSSEKMDWPSIEYKGMIKNNNSNKRIGIAIINGNEHLIKQGNIINGVTFVKIDKTEIKVHYQNSTKTISK